MSAGDEFSFRPKSVFMEEDPNVNDVSPGRKCFLHSGGASGAYKISVKIKIYNQSNAIIYNIKNMRLYKYITCVALSLSSKSVSESSDHSESSDSDKGSSMPVRSGSAKIQVMMTKVYLYVYINCMCLINCNYLSFWQQLFPLAALS